MGSEVDIGSWSEVGSEVEFTVEPAGIMEDETEKWGENL